MQWLKEIFQHQCVTSCYNIHSFQALNLILRGLERNISVPSKIGFIIVSMVWYNKYKISNLDAGQTDCFSFDF